MSLLPWSDLMRAAAHLGIPPHAFWALSVWEWRTLMWQGEGLRLRELSDLCAAFPDDIT
jgi:hypothetical protein